MMDYSSSSDDDEDIGLKSLDISNDQYYRQKLKLKITRQQDCDNQIISPTSLMQHFVLPTYGSETIRHSIAAYDLWKAFFPTYLNHKKFVDFHRPKLRHYNTGPQSRSSKKRYKGFPIKNLTRHIFKNHKALKSKISAAIRDGVSRPDIINNTLRIRETKDLSAKSGELILLEYSEEFPPVLSQVGMASNIKTYIAPLTATSGSRSLNNNNNKSSNSKSDTTSNNTDGPLTQDRSQRQTSDDTNNVSKQNSIGYAEEVAREPPSLYYCPMKPGTKVKFIENNLYRAPIFQHDIPSSDFLIIRTRNNFYVRSVRTIFTVGQTRPLIQVPPPTDRHILKFRCDLSNLYIHKLFAASDTIPPSLDLNNLVKLFPDYNRAVLRKRLLGNGAESGYLNHKHVYHKGKSTYGDIPWTNRPIKLISPEQYCSYMATLSANARLRELNYTESMINPSSEVTEIEPEILAAPWNTSKAIMNLMKGQCFLDLRKHLIDPTGHQREGFSCVPWSRSPTEEQQAKEMRANRKTGGAIKGGPAPVFGKNPLLYKIKSEKLERLAVFRKEAQLITETQAKILSCDDNLTSSEDENDDDEGDCENDVAFAQQVRDLDRLVVGGQSVYELNFDKEEEIRRQLLSDLRVNQDKINASTRMTGKNSSTVLAGDGTAPPLKDIDLSFLKGKILKITRSYDDGGTKIQRTEIVREPKVIALYAKYKGYDVSGQANSGFDGANGGKHCDRERNHTTISNPKLSSVINNADGLDSPRFQRSRSVSLGPSELCRADGIRIRISKKVLDGVRPLRNCRRESTAS